MTTFTPDKIREMYMQRKAGQDPMDLIHVLAEVAAQLAESNHLARLRLRLRLAEESIYSPPQRADIAAEIREELEAL